MIRMGWRLAFACLVLVSPWLGCSFGEVPSLGASLDQGAAGAAGSGGEGGGSAGAGGALCAPPLAACGASCADLETDAANCGECGYACGDGSSCAKGECTPVIVAPNVFAPYALALDSTNLYWTAPVVEVTGSPLPTVFKVARWGGTPESAFATSTGRSRALALSETTLYFSKLDAVGQLLKGDVRGDPPEEHVAGQVGLQHVAVAGDELVWATSDGATSRVRRARARGAIAAGDVVQVMASAQAGLTSWVWAEGSGAQRTVYWASRISDNVAPTNLWRRGPLEGVPSRILNAGSLGQFALAGDYVYLTSGPASGIVRANKAGGVDQTPTPAAPGSETSDAFMGLTASSDRLYWLTFAEGELVLHRASLDGSGARVLGRVKVKNGASYRTQSLAPAYVAVGGGDVYFADQGTLTGDVNAASNPRLDNVRGKADGTIYRLPQ